MKGAARQGGPLVALAAILLLGLGLRGAEAWDGRSPVYDAQGYAAIAANLERGEGFTLGAAATQPAPATTPPACASGGRLLQAQRRCARTLRQASPRPDRLALRPLRLPDRPAPLHPARGADRRRSGRDLPRSRRVPGHADGRAFGRHPALGGDRLDSLGCGSRIDLGMAHTRPSAGDDRAGPPGVPGDLAADSCRGVRTPGKDMGRMARVPCAVAGHARRPSPSCGALDAAQCNRPRPVRSCLDRWRTSAVCGLLSAFRRRSGTGRRGGAGASPRPAAAAASRSAAGADPRRAGGAALSRYGIRRSPSPDGAGTALGRPQRAPPRIRGLRCRQDRPDLVARTASWTTCRSR